VYPEYSEKSEIITCSSETFKKQIKDLWDKLPVFKNSMDKVPTLHIPMKKTLLSHLLLSASLFAATAPAGDNLAITSAPKEVALTLYGSNLAMITEKRSVEIEKPGQVKLMYPGVPSSIDTSSILASFSEPVRLYSQNYSYDVISYSSLLKYHLGKTIHYIEKKDSVEIKEGTLLATNPLLVRERNFGVIFTPYQIFFPDIPREMAVKPSLFWNIETRAKALDIGL
jgi:hypothetical protein